MSLLVELDSYLALLEAHGSLMPKVLKPLEDGATLQLLDALEMITVPDKLSAYFQRANGFDRLACHDLDLYEPELAWGMTPLSLEACADHYDDLAYVGGDENPTTILLDSCRSCGMVRGPICASTACNPRRPSVASMT